MKRKFLTAEVFGSSEFVVYFDATKVSAVLTLRFGLSAVEGAVLVIEGKDIHVKGTQADWIKKLGVDLV